MPIKTVCRGTRLRALVHFLWTAWEGRSPSAVQQQGLSLTFELFRIEVGLSWQTWNNSSLSKRPVCFLPVPCACPGWPGRSVHFHHGPHPEIQDNPSVAIWTSLVTAAGDRKLSWFALAECVLDGDTQSHCPALLGQSNVRSHVWGAGHTRRKPPAGRRPNEVCVSNTFGCLQCQFTYIPNDSSVNSIVFFFFLLKHQHLIWFSSSCKLTLHWANL